MEQEYEGLTDFKTVERHFKNWIKQNALKVIKIQMDLTNNKPKKLNFL